MGFLLGVALYVIACVCLVLGPVRSCVDAERAECEARACPEGTVARITRYDGCLCVVEPRTGKK